MKWQISRGGGETQLNGAKLSPGGEIPGSYLTVYAADEGIQNLLWTTVVLFDSMHVHCQLLYPVLR